MVTDPNSSFFHQIPTSSSQAVKNSPVSLKYLLDDHKNCIYNICPIPVTSMWLTTLALKRTQQIPSLSTIHIHHRALRLLCTTNHKNMNNVWNQFQTTSQILRQQCTLPSASINDQGLILCFFSEPSVSHITSTWKMHEINTSDFNWTKPDWLRKLPGREPKSSFGKEICFFF